MIKTSIVIVGGGFGGVACAKACARLFRDRPDVDIILISPRPYHDFQPALYEVATAIGEGTEAISMTARRRGGNGRTDELSCLRKAVCLPLEEVFRDTKVKLVYGRVNWIDRIQRQVLISHAPVLSYTYLVLALGSVPAYYDIPGLRENALGLKTVNDALTVRSAIQNEWGRIEGKTERSPQAREAAPLKIIIGGGGFTGTELAAELAGMLRTFAQLGAKKGVRVPYEVILLSGTTGPVSQLGERVCRMAEERLKDCGVTLITGPRVTRVERQEHDGIRESAPNRWARPDGESYHRSKIVVLNDGRRLKANILIWTGGVQAAPLYARVFPLAAGAQGRVAVEEALQVAGEERIFAVGDGAYCTDNDYPQGLPLQAWVAIAEGKHAAANMHRHVIHMPLLNFRRPRFPFIVPLGGKHAVIKLPHGRVWQGLVPWVLDQLVELRYYCSLLGLRRGSVMWWSEERICVRND